MRVKNRRSTAAANNSNTEQTFDEDSGSYHGLVNNDEDYNPPSGLVITSAVGEYDINNSATSSVKEDSIRKRAIKKNIMYWDPMATRLLIQLRTEMNGMFDANFGRRINCWIELAARMAEQGFDFSIDKMSKKWQNLVATYHRKTAQRHHGVVHWDYFDDMDAYFQLAKQGDPLADRGDDEVESNYSESDEEEEAAAAKAEGAKLAMSPVNSKSAVVKHELQRNVSASPLLVPLDVGVAQNKRKAHVLNNNNANHLNTDTDEEVKRVRPLRIVRKTLPDDQQLTVAKENRPATPEPTPPVKLQRLAKRRQSMFVDSSTSSGVPKLAASTKMANKAAAAAAVQPPAKTYLKASKYERSSLTADNGVSAEQSGDTTEAWTRDYFERKLQLERERMRDEQERHRDCMNFQKMTLMLQEKMEKNKVEALRALTDAINRLM